MSPDLAEDGRPICPRCGLPIGRGSESGPLWTPEIAGVEVCGCPPIEEQQHERAETLQRELDGLKDQLGDVRKQS